MEIDDDLGNASLSAEENRAIQILYENGLHLKPCWFKQVAIFQQCSQSHSCFRVCSVRILRIFMQASMQLSDHYRPREKIAPQKATVRTPA
jgi:hypothetical protein